MHRDAPHIFARICPLAAIVAMGATLVPAEALSQARQLEEVLVTAQKREENLQDIPVAVTAIGAEAMEALNINEVTDLTRVSASLTFSQGNQRQNTAFRIRGIGTNVFTIGIEPSVSVLIDDVAQVQPGQALTNLVDVRQVEVLRGPQSTLFGKNASAGVINVVTAAPSDELEAFAEVTATDDDEIKVIGSVAGPISDSVAYRLSGFYREQDGFADNLYNNSDINDVESQGLRGRLNWQITDNFDMALIAYYSEEEGNCCALSFRDIDPNSSLFGALPLALTNPETFNIAATDNSTVEVDNDVGSDVEDTGASIRFNWDIGGLTLSSITGFNRWDFENSEDVDFSGFDVGSAFGAAPGGIHSLSETEAELFSQELRLLSPSGERFEWLLGFYYSDAETDRSFKRPIITSDWEGTSSTLSYALFGQGTYKLTDALELTFGGRFNYEEIDVKYTDYVADQNYSGSDDEDATPWKLSLQYYLSDDAMLFASYATGHKGQAYDISSGFSQDRIDNPVGSESSESIELGIKSTLLDQRLQLNAVAFFTEYDNYQAQNTELRGTELVIGVLNVGTLETTGLELDATALLGENFSLFASFAWIDATVAEFPDANCYAGQTEAQGCVELAPGSGVTGQDLAGKPLNNSPDYKLNLGGRWQIPLSSMPFDGFLNFSYNWQDEVNFDLTQNPATVQDSYGIFNISAGINEANDRYRVTLFLENAFDEDYAATIADLAGLYGGSTAIFHFLPRNAQRYAGLKVRFAF